MAITRTLSITYGGQVVPGTGTGYQVDVVDIHQLSMDYRTLTLVFTIVLTGTGTDAQFAAQLQSLRAAFSTPNQDLTVALEGEDQFAGTTAGHTFMGSEASFEPVSGFQSARSAGMRVRISGILPADLSGQGGRFSARVHTTRTPEERRQVQITAEYSGLSGTSASGHQATFETYAAAIVGALSGTFEVALPTSVQRDDFDHAATFSITYQELLTDQSAGGRDDARMVDVRYSVETFESAGKIASGQIGSPPKRVRVSFGCGVLVSSGVTESFVVRSLILPFLASKVTEAGATGVIKKVGQNLRIDLHAKRASGSVEFLVYGLSLVSAGVTVDDLTLEGNKLVPVLDGKDPWAKDLHQGPKFAFRTVQIVTVEEGGSGDAAKHIAEAWKQRSAREGWVLDNTRDSGSHNDMVLPDGSTPAELYERAIVLFFEFGGSSRARSPQPARTAGGRPITTGGL